MGSHAKPVLDKITGLEQQWQKIEQLRVAVSGMQPAQGTYVAPANAFEIALQQWVQEQALKDPEGFAQKVHAGFKDTNSIRSKHGGNNKGGIDAPQWLDRLEKHFYLGNAKDSQGVLYNGDQERLDRDAQLSHQKFAAIEVKLNEVARDRNAIERSLAELPQQNLGMYSQEIPHEDTYTKGGVRHAFRYASSSEYRQFVQVTEKIEAKYGCTVEEVRARHSKLRVEAHELVERYDDAKYAAQDMSALAKGYKRGRMEPAELASLVSQPAFEMLRKPQVFDKFLESQKDSWNFDEGLVAAYKSCGAAFRVAPVLDRIATVVADQILKGRHAAKTLGSSGASKMAGGYYRDRAQSIAQGLGHAQASNGAVVAQVEKVLADGEGPLPQVSKMYETSGLSVGRPAQPKEKKAEQESVKRKDNDRNKRSGISFAQRAASAVM